MKKYEFAYKDKEKVISSYFNIEYNVEKGFKGILDKGDQENVVAYIESLEVGESYVDYMGNGEVYLTVTRIE